MGADEEGTLAQLKAHRHALLDPKIDEHQGRIVKTTDPNMGSFLVRLADAAYFLKHYEEAAEWARRALQQPNFQWSRYTVLIAALAQLGRLDEARNCIQQLQAKRPNTSIAFVRETHLFGDTASFAHYLDGLRIAGLPD